MIRGKGEEVLQYVKRAKKKEEKKYDILVT